MSVVKALFGLGLRAVLGDVGESVHEVVEAVQERFEDHSQALTNALTRANDQAWQALAVALAGEGFLDQIKRFFAEGEARGLRERIGGFLGRHAAYFDQTPEAFRRACLAELEQARRSGLLAAPDLTAAAAGEQAAAFPYYSNPQAVMDAAVRAVQRLADDLAPSCPHLARLLRQPTPDGPPLLISAFAFFFRREIETNDELAKGLTFESLRQLSAGQAEGFAAIGEALAGLGGRFDEVMDQLARLEATVVETRDAVLDLRSELRQLGTLHQSSVEEVRRLVDEAMARLGTAGEGSVGPGPAVRTEEEEMTVRHLVARIRRLPEDQRRQVPALLLNQWGEADAVGARNALGMAFAWIPPGSFLQGSPPEEARRRPDETCHGVTLSRGFYLSVHPVTQAQWRAVLGDNPSCFPGDDRPVECVSWQDCCEFCARLSRREGKKYRLPTEAEWEYACRAGTTTPFAFGSTLSPDKANFDGDATTPVGRFAANAWGVWDAHGNVYEWCADWYAAYPRAEVTDPIGPATGEARVLRGGSWFSAPWYCRSACRYWADPGCRSAHVGCRVCFSLD